MRHTSGRYKELIDDTSRMFCVKVNITYPDGSTVTLNDLSDFMSFKVDDACSGQSNFDIGSAIINEADISLKNRDGKFDGKDFYGATLDVWAGIVVDGVPELLKLGHYIVDEPVSPGITIRLLAYDNMLQLDHLYTPRISFPATRGALAQDACEQCGVQLAHTSFRGADEMVQTAPVDMTCREVVAAIAQLSACFARCDSDGKVAIRWYSTDVDKTISSLRSKNICTDDVTITGIDVYSGSTLLATSGATGYKLAIKDNPLIAADQAQVAADYLAECLVGLSFRPLKITCKSDPSIEAGDLIQVVDGSNEYMALCTHTTFQMHSAQKVECNATSPAVNSTQRLSDTAKAIIAERVHTKEVITKEMSAYEAASKALAGVLANSLGCFQTVEKLEDGSAITYMHDKPLLSDSKTIWKQTADAFAVSTDGGATWNAGIEADGSVTVNVLAAIGLSADWIRTGELVIRTEDGTIVFYANADTGEMHISSTALELSGQKQAYVLPTLEDVNRIQEIVVELGPPMSEEELKWYDLSNDGHVMPNDATLMQQLIAGMITIDEICERTGYVKPLFPVEIKIDPASVEKTITITAYAYGRVIEQHFGVDEVKNHMGIFEAVHAKEVYADAVNVRGESFEIALAPEDTTPIYDFNEHRGKIFEVVVTADDTSVAMYAVVTVSDAGIDFSVNSVTTADFMSFVALDKFVLGIENRLANARPVTVTIVQRSGIGITGGNTGDSTGTNITVDAQLNELSTNPVQNRVIAKTIKDHKPIIEKTEAEYEALSVEEKAADVVYFIPDGEVEDEGEVEVVSEIDDGVTATDKTWSSAKITEYVDSKEGASIEVDDELSTESTNPVQNKVVAEAIAGKADKASVTTLEKKVDGIRVGGRNLWLNSESPSFNNNLTGTGTTGAVVTEGKVKYRTITPAEDKGVNSYAQYATETTNTNNSPEYPLSTLRGENAVFSIDVRPHEDARVYARTSGVNGTIESISAMTWKRIYVSTTLDATWNGAVSLVVLESGVALDVKKVKIELGNTHTEWTPAPEDIDILRNEISSTYATKTEFNSIQIGGRNYFRPSLVNDCALGSGVVVQDASYRGYYIAVSEGEKWSVSREAATNNRFRYAFTKDEPKASVAYYNSVSADSALKIEGVVIPSGMKYLLLYLSNVGDELPNIKIERGTKCTDWTPAIEDTEERLSELEEKTSDFGESEGVAVGSSLVLDRPAEIKEFTIYGRSTQDGTPTPDMPVEIVNVGDTKLILNARWQEPLDVNYLYRPLRGIKVDSGGNYTDANGQQWICDTIEVYADGNGKHIQRIGTLTLDGTEASWQTFVPAPDRTQFFINYADSVHSTTVPLVYSNRFAGDIVGNRVKNIDTIYTHAAGIALVTDMTDSMSEFKNWLAENPVDTIYAKKEIIETPLTADEVAEIKNLVIGGGQVALTNSENADMYVSYRKGNIAERVDLIENRANESFATAGTVYRYYKLDFRQTPAEHLITFTSQESGVYDVYVRYATVSSIFFTVCVNQVGIVMGNYMAATNMGIKVEENDRWSLKWSVPALPSGIASTIKIIKRA